MLIWRIPSNFLIQFHNHIPDFREPQAIYDWDNCFNCGGEFFIEVGSVAFGFSYSRCQVCAGNGEVLVGIPNLTYPEWIVQPGFRVPLYVVNDGQINLSFV